MQNYRNDQHKKIETKWTWRPKRNDRNDQNGRQKKLIKINESQGCQAPVVTFISFRLWSTPNLPHGSYLSITISLAWGVEETILRKKINKKLTYIDVVNEYRYLFFLLLMLWYSIWFRPKNYKKKLKCFVLKTKVSNLVLAARVVEKT